MSSDSINSNIEAAVTIDVETCHYQELIALRQQAKRLQQLTDNLLGVIYQFQLEPDGSIFFSYVSSGCREILELEPEQIQQNATLVINLLHPEDRQHFNKALAFAAETLTTWHDEWRIILPSGQLKWIQAVARPHQQSNGQIVWDGWLLDITERKQAELQLKKNQEFLSSVNELILVIDCEGYILKIPSINYKLYQHNKPEIGNTLYDVFPKAIADTFWQYIQQAFETQQTVKAEYSISIKGQEVWSEVSISPIDSNWVICVINDITARKQAEAELYKSKQLLQIVMDTIPQLIFWKDKQLVYLGSNYNFARAVGVDSPEDVVGKTDYDMTWTKEEADWFQECDRQVMESNTPKLNIIETQLHADGKHTWSETNVLPLHNAEGKVVGILGTCEDITERKQAEIELRQSEAQLRQQAQELEQTLNKLQQTQAQLIQTEKMSSLGQMIAGVAHEINNPVSFIYGNLDYADNYVRDLLSLVQLYQQHYPNSSLAIQDQTEAIDFDFLAEDLPKVMSSMKMGAERIRTIVLSLRNFSRLDEAEMKFVDIHEGIDSTLLILNSQLKQGIEVIKQYETLPLIECYPAQLNQVFMNILTNAIDALLTGEQPIKQITIKSKIIESNQVEVKLRDNGPGISEQVKTKIFDPFFTTKPVGKGTGLGLAICYQIIEKHRGRIEVNSRLGKGTEFLIVLPIAQFL